MTKQIIEHAPKRPQALFWLLVLALIPFLFFFRMKIQSFFYTKKQCNESRRHNWQSFDVAVPPGYSVHGIDVSQSRGASCGVRRVYRIRSRSDTKACRPLRRTAEGMAMPWSGAAGSETSSETQRRGFKQLSSRQHSIRPSLHCLTPPSKECEQPETTRTTELTPMPLKALWAVRSNHAARPLVPSRSRRIGRAT